MAKPFKYEILRELGRGSYGTVYEARFKKAGVRVAMKKVLCDSPEASELALQELWTLSSMKKRHPNVIWLGECILQRDRNFQKISKKSTESESHLLLIETCLKGKCCFNLQSSHFLWFVMEFCDGGDMNDYLLSRGPDCRLNRTFMQQLSAAVVFLHLNQIIHRDLKPDNVLITNTPRGAVLKVADFGLSKIRQGRGSMDRRQMSTVCGSDFYMAPELWEGQYSAKVDIFALGIMFWAMIERITFRDVEVKKELLGVYVSKGRELVPVGKALMENPSLELQIPMKSKGVMNNYIQKLLKGMMAFNPQERPDAISLQAQVDKVMFPGAR
ncbi:serine/threonine-protein kinase PDIK1L-like [Scyliorhinus canicula]|uniref:serine/threonine-protein kinase PDIK1L-like n=1 Tax=Scyliorhinus canicula TaxID=7830 RepID=UPI0018F3D3FB|nr:serine/threonine-protein kinase PDIK1L-like [Scyliorhinus canicula]